MRYNVKGVNGNKMSFTYTELENQTDIKKANKNQGKNYYNRLRLILKYFYLLCKKCDSRRARELHHKNREKTDNSLQNLKPLCRSCHIEEHSGNKRINGYTYKKESEVLG